MIPNMLGTVVSVEPQTGYYKHRVVVSPAGFSHGPKLEGHQIVFVPGPFDAAPGQRVRFFAFPLAEENTWESEAHSVLT